MKWEQRGTSRKGKDRQKSRQGNRYGQKPIINVLPLPSDHYNHIHKTDLRHRAGSFRVRKDEDDEKETSGQHLLHDQHCLLIFTVAIDCPINTLKTLWKRFDFGDVKNINATCSSFLP